MSRQVALAALTQVIQKDRCQVGIMEVDWQKFLHRFSGQLSSPCFDVIAAKYDQQSSNPSRILQRLEHASTSQHRELLFAHVSEQVAKVLGLNVLRVMKDVENISDRICEQRGPSETLIEDLDG